MKTAKIAGKKFERGNLVSLGKLYEWNILWESYIRGTYFLQNLFTMKCSSKIFPATFLALALMVVLVEVVRECSS